MKIKAGSEIIVTFAAMPLEDIDSSILMEWLMDNIPNMRIQNPGYRVIKEKVEDNTK